MKLSSRIVGIRTQPIVHEIDARWMMAYAAGLGDALPCYFDTRRADGIVAHPLFPICFEWPAVLAIVAIIPASEEVRLRAVHATHDLVIHRPVRPGERLSTRAEVVGIEQRKAGAYQTMRLDTVDASGRAICTTWQGALYRGVDVEGPSHSAIDAPPSPRAGASSIPPRAEVTLAVGELAAHVYTECARIWNPIHTDRAVAASAGLPGIILHGTATLGLAVSRLLHAEAGDDPQRVRRIAGRFGAMVLMPSEITVRILERRATPVEDEMLFEVLTADGERAVRDGLVGLRR